MNRAWRIVGIGCGILALGQALALAQGPVNRPEAVERSEPRGTVRYVIRRSDSGELPTPDVEPSSTDTKSLPPDLRTRHQALEQFRLGNEALRRGRLHEAETLFAPLRTNPHFSAQERFQVERICEDLRRREGRAAASGRPVMSPVVRRDPDTVLGEARRAFAVGDYPQAEALAFEAQELGHRALLPWSDTPDKLLRDIENMRRQNMQQRLAVSGEMPSVLRASRVPGRAEHVTPASTSRPSLRIEPDAPETLKVPAETMTSAAPDPRTLVVQARSQLRKGLLDQAIALAKQAQVVRGVRWGPFEDSPERVLHDAAKVRSQQNEMKAAEVLAEARRLLDQNRLDEAERMTYQAEALRREYPFWHRGERHDRLRREIAEKRFALTKPQLPPLQAPPKPPSATTASRSTKAPTRPAQEPKRPAEDLLANSPPR